MGKGVSKYIIYLSVIFIIMIIGIYVSTQALQVELDRVSAEKVLNASEILKGEKDFSGWRFQFLELPFYLFFVKLFGLSTFAAIGTVVSLFLILYAAGILILRLRNLLNFSNLLIWTALCGTPDPAWLQAIQAAPILILSVLLIPYFLTSFVEELSGKYPLKQSAASPYSSIMPSPRRQILKNCRVWKSGILTLFFLFTAILSFPHLETASYHQNALHEMIRALQRVFRADFSQQPILSYSTGRYFFMTLILLTMILAAVRAAGKNWSVKKKGKIQHNTFGTIYAFFISLTILFCCLPFSGDRSLKSIYCAWLPFGTAMLLISGKEDMQNLRFAQGRLSYSALANIFFTLTLLFGISPIVLSRLASAADRVVLCLNEKGFRHGFCEKENTAVLTVAAKGQIDFSTDRNDPDNEFFVLSDDGEQGRLNDKTITIDNYIIVQK